jgi:HEAT repeat protein
MWHGDGVIESSRSLDAVIRHAVDSEYDYEDIAPVVKALAASGDTGLVPQLNEALDRFLDSGNFYGRDLIATILYGIQGLAALPALLRASSRDLGDDQDGLQAEITDLLRTDQAAARPMVLDFVTSGPAELRRAGVWALGFIAGPEDVEALAAAATDADPRIRSIAIGSIPDIAGDDRAYRAVVLALRDADQQVRVSAISRLGYSGRADAVGPLTALAADRTARVRSMVAYALGRLSSSAATPALLQLLRDPERPVFERAVEALGLVGGPDAVSALLALAADEDPQRRIEAANALATAASFDASAKQQLSLLAQDGEAAVRAATISGLAGAHAEPSSWAPFVAGMADDPDPLVRQRVALVARRLAPDAASGILRRYTSDPDETVRRLARRELDRLADRGTH